MGQGHCHFPLCLERWTIPQLRLSATNCHTVRNMQDQKLWMLCWCSFPRWGRERVSPFFEYKGYQLIQKKQGCTIFNILRFTVGYLNTTINRSTRNVEPDIGSDDYIQTRRNPRVDRHGYGFGLTRSSGSSFGRVWTGTELCLLSNPEPLAGYPEPLLSLAVCSLTLSSISCWPICNRINIHSVALTSRQKSRQNYWGFRATQHILIQLQIGELEMKEGIKLHILHIDYVVIWQELRCFIVVRNVDIEGAGFAWKPIAMVQVRSQPKTGTEPGIWIRC